MTAQPGHESGEVCQLGLARSEKLSSLLVRDQVNLRVIAVAADERQTQEGVQTDKTAD